MTVSFNFEYWPTIFEFSVSSRLRSEIRASDAAHILGLANGDVAKFKCIGKV